MAAALFGGFFIGLLTSILSCIIVIFGWSLFAQTPFLIGTADWIDLYVFLINCILVSAIAEYSRVQRKKAQFARQQAENANKAKSAFLANMSHQLRTPLNAILSFTRILQNDLTISDANLKSIKIVNKSGEQLLSLISRTRKTLN